MAAMTTEVTAVEGTTSFHDNVTHLYDSWEDIFIHPHWKSFPPIPDVWHYTIGVYITAVGITGVIGNLIVIYIFSKTKGLRTPSNMFVVNLALSDLIFSAVNGFPLLSISAFNKRWMFGKIACELYGLTGGIFGLMSINTLAMISIDRYFVITRPFSAMKNMTQRRAFLMIVGVWIWSIIWAVPPIFGWGAYIPEGFQTSCTFDYLTRNDHFTSYFICLYVCGFCVPVLIILFCYTFIIRAVSNHSKEMVKMGKNLGANDPRNSQSDNETSAEMKIAKVSLMIFCMFMLSWMPYATVGLIAQFGNPMLVTPYVSEIPVMFAKASAMHNPIIYALSHPKFRNALNKLFPWMMCCCQPTEKELAQSMANRKHTGATGSTNSNAYGGSVSDMSSCVSNISDSAIEMSQRGNSKRIRDRDIQETVLAGQEANGALIRDILQAFVAVSGPGNRPQVPLAYMAPQYYQYGVNQEGGAPAPAAAPAPAPVAGAPAPQLPDIYAITQSAALGVPAAAAPSPAVTGDQPAEPAKVDVSNEAPADSENKTAVTIDTKAEVTGHDNQTFEKE
nr:rhodopsin [Haliotis discus hannai]